MTHHNWIFLETYLNINVALISYSIQYTVYFFNLYLKYDLLCHFINMIVFLNVVLLKYSWASKQYNI